MADDEGYATDSTNWAFDNYIIDETDRARFYEVVADLNKRGYNVPKTKNGSYIIEHENKLMFTDGDYKAPTLSKVIVFKMNYKANMAYAKGLIFDEERDTARHGAALRTLENLYGEGYVSEFNSRSYRRNEGQNGRGKGANSEQAYQSDEEVSEPQVQYSLRLEPEPEHKQWGFKLMTVDKDGIKDFKENDTIDLYEYIRTTSVSPTPTKEEMRQRIEAGITQYQDRSAPMTDREVLMAAAEDMKVDDLTDGEVYALGLFTDNLKNLNDLYAKREEQGRLYRQQQFGKGTVDRAEAQKTLNRMKVLDAQHNK